MAKSVFLTGRREEIESVRCTELGETMRKLKNHLPALGSIGPTAIWLTLFLILPLVYVIVISFMEKNNYGGVLYQFTLEAYQNLFRLKYLRVFWVYFLLAFETALICILVGYPFAYIIARSSQKVKPFLVLFDAAILDQFHDSYLRMEYYAAK